MTKVPEVTLLFWIIKIAATTLGETAGDAASMSMNLCYLVATGIFASIFCVAVIAQILAKRFHPLLYWGTIIATTTVGTTLADFADRSLGIGYVRWNVCLVRATHGIPVCLAPYSWFRFDFNGEFCEGGDVLLGYDYVVPDTGHSTWRLDCGFGGVGLCGWSVRLQRPLGIGRYWLLPDRVVTDPALLGSLYSHSSAGSCRRDFLDKPLAAGGLALSRYTASGVLLMFIVVCVFAFRHKPAIQSH